MDMSAEPAEGPEEQLLRQLVDRARADISSDHFVGTNPSQQIELNVRVHATQATGGGGEYGPATASCGVDNVSGTAIEDASREQQFDLAGRRGVELAEYQGRVTQHLRVAVWRLAGPHVLRLMPGRVGKHTPTTPTDSCSM